MNSNNNSNNRNSNFNNFKELMKMLKEMNRNPQNCRKNLNNAIRENFERSLGYRSGTLKISNNPSTVIVNGPNYKNNNNFFNALENYNPNAIKRLYKMNYA